MSQTGFELAKARRKLKQCYKIITSLQEGGKVVDKSLAMLQTVEEDLNTVECVWGRRATIDEVMDMVEMLDFYHNSLKKDGYII